MSSEGSDSFLHPPDPDSPENILNELNDHCLSEIFASSDLDEWDLLQIAGVCRRFEPIAKSVFNVKFKKIEGEYYCLGDNRPFEQFLETFGESILCLESISLNEKKSELVTRFCPNLKELKCRVHEQATIDVMRDLITRLKSLQICLPSSVSLANWFGPDIQLENWTIVHESYDLRLPHGNLPKLIEFDFNFSLFFENEAFFHENPQLEHLSIGSWYEFRPRYGYSCFGSLSNLRSVKLSQV